MSWVMVIKKVWLKLVLSGPHGRHNCIGQKVQVLSPLQNGMDSQRP